jgi:hypothetical protein
MLEQIVPYLATVNGATAYAAGGQPVASFNDLPNTVDGDICHLAGIFIDIEYTPTFTTAPTIYGINNLVSALVISDGVNPRCDVAGFNALRSFEIFETGDVLTPDPDTNSGSGNRFRVSRLWLPGHGNLEQRDFMLPIAAIRNGELRMTWGALASHSADTTAITINRLSVVAMLALRPGEFRIPPFYERRTQLLASTGQSIQGQGKYATLGLTKTNYAAFAAGDLGNLTVDTGKGIKGGIAIPAAAYDGVNQALLKTGPFTKIRGEFAAATVDNEKTVNLGTPTALTAPDATHQSLYTTPRGGFITKIPLEGKNVKVNWTGTFGALNAQYGRIVPQSPSAVAAMAVRACTDLERPFMKDNLSVATRSKKLYNGDGSVICYKYKT